MAQPEPVRRAQTITQQVPDKLGELLMRTGKINQTQLNEALSLQKEHGGRVGINLVKLGYLTEKQLVDSLSQHFKVPSVAVSAMVIDDAGSKVITADNPLKSNLMPRSNPPARVH